MNMLSAAFMLEENPSLMEIKPIMQIKLGYGFHESFHYSLSEEIIKRSFVFDTDIPLAMSYVLVLDKREKEISAEGLELGIEYRNSLIDGDVKRALLDDFYENITNENYGRWKR